MRFLVPIPAAGKDVERIVNWSYSSGTDDDPTEIMRVHVEVNGPNPEVKIINKFELQMSLSDRERPVTILNLVLMIRTVESIVDQFRSQF